MTLENQPFEKPEVTMPWDKLLEERSRVMAEDPDNHERLSEIDAELAKMSVDDSANMQILSEVKQSESTPEAMTQKTIPEARVAETTFNLEAIDEKIESLESNGLPDSKIFCEAEFSMIAKMIRSLMLDYLKLDAGQLPSKYDGKYEELKLAAQAIDLVNHSLRETDLKERKKQLKIALATLKELRGLYLKARIHLGKSEKN